MKKNIFIQIPFNFVLKGPIGKESALIQLNKWNRTADNLKYISFLIF